MSTNICSEKLEQYNFHRSRLIDFCDKADKELKKAAEIQKRPDNYKNPAEKLKADTYTLVLIGAFQSGKSTLFNYLCDGWELSPVGPGGGGIRTSGCQVTAHPIKEGEKERAEITWRSPAELLSALGSCLIEYFEEPSSPYTLTEKEVNLASEQDRAKLAGFAVQKLTDPEEKLSDNDRELLRFTLIVCKFYDQFAACCSSGKSTCSLEDSVKLSSYPQDWCSKWQYIEETQDWSLPGFTADEVNFAFCGGVELFLDSPILRSLGCSIIDCPGLFISKWDTDIATRCIREANAILYMFGGNKALTQEDLAALKTAVQLGGRHKIIFGANLHVARVQWDNILQNAIIPTLKTNGFDNPVVHNFHSAIALRSRELMLCEYDMLSPMSEAAIKLDISLGKKDMEVIKFLRRQLDKHISNLTNWDEGLEDYKDDYNALDQLSGVPAFVSSANEFVVRNRAVSILVHEGTQQISDALQLASAELGQKVELLEKDVKQAREILDGEEAALKEFQRSRKLYEDNITNALKSSEDALKKHYESRVVQKLADHKEKLIDITLKEMPNEIAAFFIDKNKRCKKYSAAVGEVLKSVLEEIRKEILAGFTGLSAFVAYKDAYEGNRNKLLQEAEAFKELKGLASINPQFPESFVDSVHGMSLPQAEKLMEEVCSQKDKFWTLIWAILTFGLLKGFKNYTKRAEAIVEKFLNEFQKMTFDQLWKCMDQDTPAGPMKALNNSLNDFSKCFNEAEKIVRRNLDGAKSLLDDVECKADVVPTYKQLSAELLQLKDECGKLEARVREDFPSS
ncbi:MAG: dynamin family protein [Akkermansia sp.]|nr:dynamin family protein [Akkermansia sp.]